MTVCPKLARRFLTRPGPLGLVPELTRGGGVTESRLSPGESLSRTSLFLYIRLHNGSLGVSYNSSIQSVQFGGCQRIHRVVQSSALFENVLTNPSKGSLHTAASLPPPLSHAGPGNREPNFCLYTLASSGTFTEMES